MTTEQQTPLHIVELRAENVKRLQAVTVRPDGNVVVIGGRNAQGKTSLLDAIEMALGGAKTIPVEPVRRGARKGGVFLDLGEIKVERKFSPKGSTLEVRTADGTPQKSPQGILDALTARVCFDPLEFARSDAAKQDATLKAVLGLDFTEQDARRKEAYDNRTHLNRELKTLKAKLEGTTLHVAPTEEVSVAELSEKLDRIREEEREQAELREKCARLDEAANKQAAAYEEHLADIRQLKETLAELESQTEGIARQMAESREAEEAVRALVDELEPPDPEPIKQQIATAEETNRKVRANAARREIEARLSALEEQVELQTNTIAEADAEKQGMLEAAEFPVAGLGFDDTGPTLNGIPLDQCSQAERLRVSVAIGAALNPRCRVMLVRDGALLDQESMRLLAELAQQTGSQVWLERVGDGDASAIIIEDGLVRKTAETAAE